MGNLLQGCFLYRWALAIFAWFSRVADGSRVRRGISVCWESSKLAAFLHRCLSSGTVQIDESRTKHLLSDCNERLCARKSTARWVESSVLYRVYRGVFTCGRSSRIFGWLFRGGMTAILLFAIGLYVLIDYVLRDVLAIPVVSSVWDEALLLFCIVWLIWERKKAASAIAPKLNPLDFPVAVFLTVCFVLLCVVCPYLSIQIAGFRATCQYLLWFYLVTRLIRNDRDCMTLYLTLVGLSFVLSLHGIYQYITKAPMPASWVAQAETAVRTRVYSIFGSPNIMGDFMVMFVPMTAALAYYAEKPKFKVLAWLAAFGMCLACLFTMSRGAWVAMALAIVLFILLVDRRLFLPLAAGLVLLVLVPFVRTRIGFLFTQDFVDANTNGGRGGSVCRCANAFWRTSRVTRKVILLLMMFISHWLSATTAAVAAICMPIRPSAPKSTCPGPTISSIARPTRIGTNSVPATLASASRKLSTTRCFCPSSSPSTRRSVFAEEEFCFILHPPS